MSIDDSMSVTQRIPAAPGLQVPGADTISQSHGKSQAPRPVSAHERLPVSSADIGDWQ
jgi:hypothetical protein